jgi:hypothetical protein
LPSTKKDICLRIKSIPWIIGKLRFPEHSVKSY